MKKRISKRRLKKCRRYFSSGGGVINFSVCYWYFYKPSVSLVIPEYILAGDTYSWSDFCDILKANPTAFNCLKQIYTEEMVKVNTSIKK